MRFSISSLLVALLSVLVMTGSAMARPYNGNSTGWHSSSGTGVYRSHRSKRANKFSRKRHAHKASRKRYAYKKSRKRHAYKYSKKRRLYKKSRKRRAYKAKRKRYAYKYGKKRRLYKKSRKRSAYKNSRKRRAYNASRKRRAYKAARKRQAYPSRRKRVAARRSYSRSSYSSGSYSAGRRPRQWCGWWMRKQRGGGPALNVARNWARWGRATTPRVGAVVVWRNHVAEIVGRSANGQWITRGGNESGRVRTRARSLKGAIAFRM
jgi:hypothetical protein